MTELSNSRSKEATAAVQDSYDCLFAKLASVRDAVKGGAVSDLDAGLKSLWAVISFLLGSDPAFAMEGLLAPLNKLALALHDASQGEKPPLLYEIKLSGCPTHTSEAMKRASILQMLDRLEGANIKYPEKWLAEELARAGIQNKNKGSKNPSITGRQIRRWSQEHKGKSLSGSDLAKEVLAQNEVPRNWPINEDSAKGWVLSRISSLKASGF